MNEAAENSASSQYTPPVLVSTLPASNNDTVSPEQTMPSLPQHPPIDNIEPTQASTPAATMPPEQEESTQSGGGRLWKLAGDEAHHQQQQRQQQVNQTNNQNNNNKWAETFKARTRSCAEPNATTTTANADNTTSHINLPSPPDLVAVTVPGDQLVFPDRDVLPVAQLLILGMVGILVGWLGNAVVGASCHFASVDVAVGQKDVELHFGLYKYSTADSGLNGYEYCVPYGGGSYAKQAPMVARTMNVLALFFGTLSLIVIWWTLVVGTSLMRPWIWKWSTRAAVCAGLCQLSTLSFYVETICRQHSCHMGPASYLNGISSVVWFGIAREMRLRSPAWMVDDNIDDRHFETNPMDGLKNHKAGLELHEQQTRASLYEPPGIPC